MVATDQPGVVGVAERLPYNPDSQNEMPLSSAREISGKQISAAAVAAHPMRRMLVVVIANLRAVLAFAALQDTTLRHADSALLTVVGHKVRRKSVAVG